MADEFKRLIEAVQSGDGETAKTILEAHPEYVHARDELGATALHHAAFGAKQEIVRLLLERGADINARDAKFGATPTGWAIEYLREMGGLLGIELTDFAHAIERGDVEWVARFLRRFPSLREAKSAEGKPFRQMAKESGNPEIANLLGDGRS